MLILLILIIKRLGNHNELSITLNRIVTQLVTKLKYVLPFLLISFTASEHTLESFETIRFDIVKKSKIIGFVNLQKENSNETTTYRIKSEVNAKFLVEFKANSKETYVYENDTLIYSSIYRTINDIVKVDQSLSYNEGNYLFKQKKRNQFLNKGAIKCNLVQLYFKEPLNMRKVYCDKLNVYLTVKNIDSHKYKVTFPNKSYNIFYYKNGKCTLIEAGGSFYNVKLVLNHGA